MFEYLQTDPIVQAMGWTLVHSLWQTIIIAIILRAILIFISAGQARLRYTLSLLALVTVFVSSIWTLQTHYRVERAALDIKIATQSMPPFEMTGTATTPTPVFEVEYEKDNRFWNGLNRRIHSLIPLLPTIVLLWLTGSLMVLIWLAYSWWDANRLVNLKTSPVPAQWLQRLDELRERMGVTREVRLYFSEKVSDALTLKHFKPVILLPIGILNALSTAEVEAILLHELAHIRRWDYLVNCFQLVLEVLFFYHPAVWWIGRQVREAREHCCDDLALKLGGSDPLEYAQALTNLTAFSFTQKIPFAMNAKGNKKDFTVRIKRLFGVHPTRTLGKSFLSALLAGLMLLIFTLSARAEFYEFIAVDDPSELEILPQETASTNPTLEQFLLAWLYKESINNGKKTVLNAPLEGGMFINISGSSGSIYDGEIPVFIFNGQRVANPNQDKVPDVIKEINVKDLYTIGLVRGTKAAEYGISDLQQKVIVVATNDWAAENMVKEEDKGIVRTPEKKKEYTDSMTMIVTNYIRSDDFFMGSNPGNKPVSMQFKITQEDNPTSYPIYILNGKEVPISRYGKFPPALRKVKVDSLVILGDEEAARYGERGQEAGVFLLYDKLEGEKPIGRLTRKEKKMIESSLLIHVDAIEKDLKVSVEIPATHLVKVHVLDQEQEVVRQLSKSWTWPGQKDFKWNFKDIPAGMYSVKVEVGELVMIRDIEL